MTPTPWGQRNPGAYWSGLLKGVVVAILSAVILVAVVSIIIAYWALL